MSDQQDEPREQGLSVGVAEEAGEVEEVDAEPVPEATERERVPVLQAALSRPLAELRAAPGAQAAAVAAGGFVAGAAVVGLTRRRRSAAPRRHRLLRRDRRSERLPIVASRSFLVDLHVLGSNGRGR
ncbi:MAG: hypothetical protein ACYCU0_01585 [Solirubrobacteraceae bacterium]